MSNKNYLFLNTLLNINNNFETEKVDKDLAIELDLDLNLNTNSTIAIAKVFTVTKDEYDLIEDFINYNSYLYQINNYYIIINNNLYTKHTRL